MKEEEIGKLFRKAKKECLTNDDLDELSDRFFDLIDKAFKTQRGKK